MWGRWQKGESLQKIAQLFDISGMYGAVFPHQSGIGSLSQYPLISSSSPVISQRISDSGSQPLAVSDFHH